jgi:hypothetical protein
VGQEGIFGLFELYRSGMNDADLAAEAWQTSLFQIIADLQRFLTG